MGKGFTCHLDVCLFYVLQAVILFFICNNEIHIKVNNIKTIQCAHKATYAMSDLKTDQPMSTHISSKSYHALYVLYKPSMALLGMYDGQCFSPNTYLCDQTVQ